MRVRLGPDLNNKYHANTLWLFNFNLKQAFTFFQS
jgi:hypothetical protein